MFGFLHRVSSFPPPLQTSLLGSETFEGSPCPGPVLSKAEFVEKVRQSNQACHAGDFHKAIVLYSEALGVDPQNCILYSNRSAAYMKTQQFERALEDAIKARLMAPKWAKVGRSPLRRHAGLQEAFGLSIRRGEQDSCMRGPSVLLSSLGFFQRFA